MGAVRPQPQPGLCARQRCLGVIYRGVQWAGLPNWADPTGNGQLNHGTVALFQGTFAIITPALVPGAVVERMQFRAWLLFLVLWSLLVYLPMAPTWCE